MKARLINLLEIRTILIQLKLNLIFLEDVEKEVK